MKNYFILLMIKNAQLSKKKHIFQKKSNSNKAILNFLWNTGYIMSYNINKNKIKINLKYLNNKPIINRLKIISKPSREIFFSVKQLWKLNPNKLYLISTIFGLKSIIECKKEKLGGKLILIVN